MIKLIGPLLLVLVIVFGFASFYARAAVPAISVVLIFSVLFGVIVTIVAEVRDARRKERENAG